MGGLNHSQTMKLNGRIKYTNIIITIDSGASHNFISKCLSQSLGGVVDETVQFGVYLGDGCRVPCTGIFRNLRVNLGVCNLAIDACLFELGGVDLILRVDWLRTLGEVRVNWSKMEMKFFQNTREVMLRGDPSLHRSFISLCSFTKTTDILFCGALWISEIKGDIPDASQASAVQSDSDLLALLRKFDHIFAAPCGLPPCRREDHTIPIKEGCGPVSVRPYRYAHIQKNEMERLVAEMLSSGIIQSSNSPYYSPVILVKKRMEVGYFVLTTGPSTISQWPTNTLFPLCTSCLMNFMVLNISQNWI